MDEAGRLKPCDKTLASKMKVRPLLSYTVLCCPMVSYIVLRCPMTFYVQELPLIETLVVVKFQAILCTRTSGSIVCHVTDY